MLSYLQYRKNEAKVLDAWHSLLSSIASTSAHGTSLDQIAVAHLLAAVQKGSLPGYLKPQDGELDSLVGTVLGQALDGPIGSEDFVLAKQILVSSGLYLHNHLKPCKSLSIPLQVTSCLPLPRRPSSRSSWPLSQLMLTR